MLSSFIPILQLCTGIISDSCCRNILFDTNMWGKFFKLLVRKKEKEKEKEGGEKKRKGRKLYSSGKLIH
jgi:hypothetical protein